MLLYRLFLVASIFYSCKSAKEDSFKIILQSELSEITEIQHRVKSFRESADQWKLDSRYVHLQKFSSFIRKTQQTISYHAGKHDPDMEGLRRSMDTLVACQQMLMGTRMEFRSWKEQVLDKTNYIFSRIEDVGKSANNSRMKYIATVCLINQLLSHYCELHYGTHCGYGPRLDTRILSYSKDSMLLEVFVRSDYHNVHPFSVYYHDAWHEVSSEESVVGRILLPADAHPTQLKFSIGKEPNKDYEIRYINKIKR